LPSDFSKAALFFWSTCALPTAEPSLCSHKRLVNLFNVRYRT
jgi:hypothetical protein